MRKGRKKLIDVRRPAMNCYMIAGLALILIAVARAPSSSSGPTLGKGDEWLGIGVERDAAREMVISEVITGSPSLRCHTIIPGNRK